MRDIVIWGTGTVARGLYYKIARDGDFKVRYFIDNAPVRSFYDCDVCLPTRENCSKYLVVVASNICRLQEHLTTDTGFIQFRAYII